MVKIGWTVPKSTNEELISSEIKKSLTNLVGDEIVSIKRIYGGQNNRLYRLTCSNSKSYVAKFYPAIEHPKDGSLKIDRLTVEFSSLSFLYGHNLNSVPKPIISDDELGCGIYQYVEGQIIPAHNITKHDIDQAVQCLINIKALCKSKGSTRLPPAAEACFSLQDVLKNIDQRLARLRTVALDKEPYQQLHSFLTSDFVPAFTEIQQWSESTYKGWGISSDQQLDLSERTLSPSDFGFHNALKQPDSQIVFLDFEYFGWDDPAKMISDFLIHPAMALDEILRKRFLDGILSGFNQNEQLIKRLSVLYPLFALKWCMIILNEFLPEKLARRDFSNSIRANLDEIQKNQLKKAKGILDYMKENYSRLPHAR